MDHDEAPSEEGERAVDVGDRRIEYELTFSERKTLAISVHPDLRVVVTAPLGTDPADVDERVRRRARWIARKQRQYERYLPHLPPRQYVSGETHRYLGRQYRLKVIDGAPEGVAIDGSFLRIVVPDKSNTDHVREVLDAWYRARAEKVFAERLEACFPKMRHMGVEMPQLSLRAMRTQWGSLSPSGRLTLNPKLVQMPKRLIDYVVYHELCHLAEPHHGPAYYELLSRVLPDWRKRREALNMFEF